MKTGLLNVREEWYDPEAKVSLVWADVTAAAQALASGHLCGPTSAYFLARALAAAAALASETSEPEEVLSLQLKGTGPIGGLNVECTADGQLRGYPEKKLLEEFDGLGKPSARAVLGATQLQVTRSVPGRILSQGISNSLDGYLAGSLQRKACLHLAAAVTDEVEVLSARALLIEVLPDSSVELAPFLALTEKELAVAPRTLLKRLKLESAEKKRALPLRFACRCSPERAAAMLAALSAEERAAIGNGVNVTCHMCGRTYEVR